MTYIDWARVDTSPKQQVMAIELIVFGLFFVALGFLMLIMNI